MNSPFEIQATIELTEVQIAELLSYAIEKKYGLEVKPDRWEVRYTGDYDSQTFAGYKVGMKLTEVQELGLLPS